MLLRASFRRRRVPAAGPLPGLLAAGILALLPLARAVAAQQSCDWGSGTLSFSSVALPSIGRVTYVSHPHLVCADGVQIWADSAVSYSDQGWSDLWGHVRYQDRTRELHADTARYFSQLGRLQAHGSVFVRDTAQGSTIRNGDLVYLRADSSRAEDQMTVTARPGGARPHAVLHMRAAVDTVRADTAKVAPRPDIGVAPAVARPDTAAAKPDTAAAKPDTGTVAVSPAPPDTTPYDVVANRIFLQGNRYALFTGEVVIHRDSLHAFSDSATYDQAAGRLLLNGAARVNDPPYDLTSQHMDIAVPGGAIRSVLATKSAVLVGQDLRLTSPSIRMFMKGGLLDRLVAVPLVRERDTTRDTTKVTPADSGDAARPVAVVEKYHLTADSLQVDAPGQELKRIFAAGNALGQSYARDSLNVPSLPEVARSDWLKADTVIVGFVPVPPDSDSAAAARTPADSTRPRFRVDRLVGIGNARSLYRLPPQDSTAPPGRCPPAVNYATGTEITLAMDKGQVDSMQVEGGAKGYHLEPAERCPADTTKVGADSTKAGADTTKAGTDTTRLRTDTIHAGRPPDGPPQKGGKGHPGGGGAPWPSEPRRSWPAAEARP